MLGKLWSAHGDTAKAVQLYTEALKLNPFMWDAFTDLCNMGAFVRPTNIYKITPEMLVSITHSVSNGTSTVPPFAVQESAGTRNPFVATPEVDPFNPSQRTGADIGLNLGGSNLLSKLNGSMQLANGHEIGSGYLDIETPTSNGQNIPDDDIMMGDVGGPVGNEGVVEIPPAPGRKTRLQPFTTSDEPPKMRHITSRVRQKMSSETDATEIPRPIGPNGHKRTVSGQSMRELNHPPPSSLDPTAAPPRRSVRLLNSISSQIRPSASRLTAATSRESESKERRELRRAKAPSAKVKAGSVPQAGRAVSGNRKPTVEISDAFSKPDSRPLGGAMMAAPPSRAPSNDIARDREALEWLLDLFRRFGAGYSQIGRFHCAQALETFMAIPTAQRETPWVLAQIGKAHYERSEFAEAEKMFMRIRDKVPSYMEDMEVFSNVLWQLKKETELSYLAHTLMDQDRLSPQAWCAIGNAFSLQREHDQAIKCFSRATQLDPKFAYAFTLQGHEHVTNEEYDKAMLAYRHAISADKRHYNGWYGLGQVFEKMGKYDVAERHYRSAAHINPHNALLAVKIGTVSPVITSRKAIY
jgi:anaphase-promoting complex subunit 3